MEDTSLVQKEAINQSSEVWVDVSDSTKESIGSLLKDSGNSSVQTQEALVFTNPDKNRFKQVVIALEYAISSVSLNETQITKEMGYQAAGCIAISSEKDDFIVCFYKTPNFSDDKYAQSRNAQLKKVNELLETFGKPLLPPYISQNRKEV